MKIVRNASAFLSKKADEQAKNVTDDDIHNIEW